MLDQTSLLMAIGFSASAITLTLLLTWLGTRTDRYLLSWGIGLALVVPGVGLYGWFETYVPAVQFASFTLLVTGFASIYIGSAQFRTGQTPIHIAATGWGLVIAFMGTAFALGLSGVGTAIMNMGSAWFFIMAGREHWEGRRQFSLAMLTMALLYGLTAITFLLCGVALLQHEQFVLVARPDGWAEDFNTIALIVTLAAAGAMTMALHQMRSSEAHRRLAMTDALTGLLNRRALFDLAGTEAIAPSSAVIMLDLDDFKTINDRFGHAIGDEVLARFAMVLRDHLAEDDSAARLGGEEFCLLLRNSDARSAHGTAERIRIAFSATPHLSAEYGSPTVSAGIAMSSSKGENFDQLLRRADELLYRAKRDGRNRVLGPEPRLVA